MIATFCNDYDGTEQKIEFQCSVKYPTAKAAAWDAFTFAVEGRIHPWRLDKIEPV